MAPTTRERLLDAALAAFAKSGIEGTAITDLEHAAGLAAGSGGFYRYFRTKDEVLDAAVRREIERVRTRRRPPADLPVQRGDAAATHEWLTRSFDEALSTLDTLGPLIAILARERARIPELAREIAVELVSGGAYEDRDLVAVVRDATDGTGAVVISAIVGYHLATDYFGSPPAGVDRASFIDALVELIAPTSQDSADSRAASTARPRGEIR